MLAVERDGLAHELARYDVEAEAILVNSPNAGQPGPFTADVKYTVARQTQGRIVVFDASPRDGGITHLASVEVVLGP